jgi:hypothetical protein
VTSLALRRGTVVSVDRAGPAARLTVEIDGEQRDAVSYERLTGPVEAGDDVVVNVAAQDLGLGSGGFDIVHVNLTRGLDGAGLEGAHVMKLNYTSLQHAVLPLEERALHLQRPIGKPVAVISLHGQLPCVAWAAAKRRPGARIGYVQTAGGALSGELSDVVVELRERELVVDHVTAASAFGGELESVSTAGAIHTGLTELGWDACIAGPGPGILGSATALGHGGMAALDTAHAALALGCRTILVPRMSAADPRPRHRGLSHHSATVLQMLLKPVIVAVPDDEFRAVFGKHEPRWTGVDLRGYAASGLPARTMGRSIGEDQLFFRAALAGGAVLGDEMSR